MATKTVTKEPDAITVPEAGPTRAHPDLFTANEAAAYLHLDSLRSLETCRAKFGLIGYPGVNRAMLYWREDLDLCAKRIVGRDMSVSTESGRLRISGTRA